MLIRSPRTRSASPSPASPSRWSTAPCRSEMAVTRMLGRSVASPIMEPVRAVLFDYGHTLVDFHRTEEALQAAYEQIRARIEAVAYMEVPEILDLIERVARGVDLMVRESYEAHRLEELDPAALFGEALAGIGFDLPRDVIDHIV